VVVECIRATPEIGKHLDVLAYRAGHDVEKEEFPACTTTPKFFFTRDELLGRVAAMILAA